MDLIRLADCFSGVVPDEGSWAGALVFYCC